MMKNRLVNLFNRKAGSDTDEVTGLGKGARWLIFAILIAVIVSGVGLFVKNYQSAGSKVNTQMDNLTNQIDTAEGVITE